MIKFIRKLFGPGERISRLAQEIEEQRRAVDRFYKTHGLARGRGLKKTLVF